MEKILLQNGSFKIYTLLLYTFFSFEYSKEIFNVIKEMSINLKIQFELGRKIHKFSSKTFRRRQEINLGFSRIYLDFNA